MKSLRNPFLLFLAAITLTAACQEFPEPLEPGSETVRVKVVPIVWPDLVPLGSTVDVEVELRDEQDRLIATPLSLQWAITRTAGDGNEEPGSAVTERRVTGIGLGEIAVGFSIDQEPFERMTWDSTMTVVLAGVEVIAPSKDTLLTAQGDEITFQGRGKDADGTDVQRSGLSWRVNGNGVLEVSSQSSDQMVATSIGEGVDTVFVSHAMCTGMCEDTVIVTVDQQPTTVEVTPPQDTLVAEDVVTLTTSAQDANGNAIVTETYTWTSSDETVATVDGSGNVTAVATGSAVITATAENESTATADIEVLASGVLEVSLTDAPADLLSSAVVYFGGIYLLDNQAANGRRYIEDTPFSQDMLLLSNSNRELGSVRVPVGTYGTVFLQIDSAIVTLKSEYEFDDATVERKLVPPSASADSLEAPINGSATLTADQTLSIIVDFDVDNSFPMPEPDPTTGVIDGVSFTPETRVIKEAEAGTLSGAVSSATAATADLTMKAVRTDVVGDTVFARTALDGSYNFRYLVPGTYTVTVPAAPACHVANPASLTGQTVPTGGALTGVNFSVDQVAVDSVVIAPTSDTINAIGYATELSAEPFQGTTPLEGLAITWSSLDPTLATVDANGAVTAVATGTARIVATSCEKADTAEVLVQQVPATVAVSPASADIESGQTQQFAATLQDSAGVDIPGATFSWLSSDDQFATVDGNGLATAVRSGSVEIIAEHVASGITGSATLGIAIAAAETMSVFGGQLGCLLTASDEVLCWGISPHGAVGTTAPNSSWSVGYRPQSIALPAADYVDVSAGITHACAVTAGGDIYCWGSGSGLGDGVNSDTPTPVLVTRPAGEAFRTVAAGEWFTCATTDQNKAYCWGDNRNGNLGNGSFSGFASEPVAVSQAAGVDFVQLAVTNNYDATVCGLGSTGRVYCWGYGGDGQIGNNSFSNSPVPTLVTMPSGVTFTKVDAGSDTVCARADDGTVYCWGWDNNGSIRDADGQRHQAYPVPTQVGTRTFDDIGFGGGGIICGITSTGAVECSGNNNYYAQRGDGTTDSNGSLQWEPAASGLTAAKITGGGSSTCALSTGGEPHCWGWKNYGIMGTGDDAFTADPVSVSLPGVVDLGRGPGLTCALTGTPELYCWESLGSLTGYTMGQVATPTDIRLPAGESFTGVGVGNGFVCVLTADGEIFCRGEGWDGRLGDGTFNSSTNGWVRATAPAGVTFTTLDLGQHHACAMGSDGVPYCWGNNQSGQLGDGTFESRGAPTAVSVTGGFTFDSVVAGHSHTCSTTPSGATFCWGFNGNGELGIGSAGGTYAAPQQVQTPTEYIQVAPGRYHSCGLSSAGAAECWGWGGNGNLGNNTSNSSASPVAVSGGYLFESIFVPQGGDYSCGVEAGGATFCWGENWQGQYGTGAYDSQQIPVQAMGGINNSLLSGSHTGLCTLDTSGAVWCMGGHEHGATGIGIFGYELLPVRVGGAGGS